MKHLIAALEAAKQPYPTVIHTSPCAHCPSAAYTRDGFDDPLMVEAKEEWSREEQVESVFRCAWRTEKLCKGYCDYLSVTEADLR